VGDVELFGDRIKACAADAGIRLTYSHGIWVAEDVDTGERASDITIAGAWATLRGESLRDVHDYVMGRCQRRD
jgi:hypothetical protein